MKNRLATTLHSIGDAVITTNLQGQIVLMNRMAENLTGWSWAQARNKPLNQVFNPAKVQVNPGEQSDDMSDHRAALDTDDSLMLISRDGRKSYISVSQSRIEDQAHQFFWRSHSIPGCHEIKTGK